MKTLSVSHISVSVNKPAKVIYDYVASPTHLPQWASGLSQGAVSQVNGDWIVDSPLGKVKVKFAPENDFGVLDHEVTLLDSGARFYNPMRVIENNEGSEVIFTLFRQADMSDEKFEQDRQWVEKDLKQLKALLENSRA